MAQSRLDVSGEGRAAAVSHFPSPGAPTAPAPLPLPHPGQSSRISAAKEPLPAHRGSPDFGVPESLCSPCFQGHA